MSGRRTGFPRGSILVYVVWGVLLLSLFAASVSSQALFTLGLSERLTGQLRAAYAARGALRLAALMIERDLTPMVDGTHEAWSDRPDLFREHPLAGGSFTVVGGERADGETRYGVNDEQQRANLNTAPAEVLQRLLEDAGGLNEREAAEIADAIEDWRDADDDPRPFGAEGFYYRSLRDPYPCKDGPFENVEELLLVRGMTAGVYHRLEPHLTVYGSGGLNLNTAGPTVIRALGLSQAGVDGLLTFRAGEDNLEGTTDDRQFASVSAIEPELASYLPQEDLVQLADLVQERFLTVGSKAFRMSLHAQTEGPSSQVQVTCVLDRDGRLALWDER